MTDATPPAMLDKDGQPVVKGRIRPALDTAIRLIEEEGYTIADAAKAVGYRTHSLVQALHKPHVRAHRASVKHAWRDGVTSQAWVRMAKLALGAVSEDVQHKSAKFLIEKAEEAEGRTGAAATQLVQILVQNANITAQLPASQMRGVIEAPAWRPVSDSVSNSDPVGRADPGREDDA